MRGLEVPLELAGHGVQGDQRRSVEIGSFAIGAVEVRGWCADGDVDDAAFCVDGAEAPTVGARSISPFVFLPGVVVGLARARDGVEGPNQFSCAHAPSTDVAGGPQVGAFL